MLIDELQPQTLERVLGWVRGGRPGPTLICTGGIHGNEPAGVVALRRVLPRLQRRQSEMSGDFVALAGNLAALRAGRRYLSRDLNRLWTDHRIEQLNAGNATLDGPDTQEQYELWSAVQEALVQSRGPVFGLDLHTTSGDGGAFTVTADTLRNRDFALYLPVPLVLGLEELVEGTWADYLGGLGHTAMVFESGQHEELAAADRAEAGIWITIASSGLLPQTALPESTMGWKQLSREAYVFPRVLEMRYRHPVNVGDGFRMKPGYRNFQDVKRGEVLASNRRGPVQSPEKARLLMPLYQELGNDGFFIVKEFAPFWLHVSRLLRRLRLAGLVHLLPGVQRVRQDPDLLYVNRTVARWLARQFLHLLGYRKRREEGDTLVMVRRKE